MVAVVGRPNVGKSTLVNRIVGRREAIVEERPGVTRDRKVLDAEWAGQEFSIVDTGGWLAAGDSLARSVSAQSERAIAEAAVVMLVVDAAVGITDEDARVAGLLRRLGRPTLVVANKVDGDSRDIDAWVFARLGLGDPFPVSAIHGRGTGDLLDEVVARLPADRGADRPAGARRASPSRRWPSWGGPMSASPPCSTGSSATSGRWCTTCPAPPETASTPWCPRPTAT